MKECDETDHDCNEANGMTRIGASNARREPALQFHRLISPLRVFGDPCRSSIPDAHDVSSRLRIAVQATSSAAPVHRRAVLSTPRSRRHTMLRSLALAVFLLSLRQPAVPARSIATGAPSPLDPAQIPNVAFWLRDNG